MSVSREEELQALIVLALLWTLEHKTSTGKRSPPNHVPFKLRAVASGETSRKLKAGDQETTPEVTRKTAVAPKYLSTLPGCSQAWRKEETCSCILKRLFPNGWMLSLWLNILESKVVLTTTSEAKVLGNLYILLKDKYRVFQRLTVNKEPKQILASPWFPRRKTVMLPHDHIIHK